jgi:hypothetical protein
MRKIKSGSASVRTLRTFETSLGPSAEHIGSDLEIFHRIAKGSPEPGSWTRRATGTNRADPNRRKTIPIEDRFVVSDAKPPITPNACAALLHPDGRTILQLNPLCRPKQSGPVWGWLVEADLLGDGLAGGHGGSGLSTIRGSIRPGELTGERPLRHAIKLNLWAERYYHYRADDTPGYRWPANRADSYAAKSYQGTNPELEIGALLAIPRARSIAKDELKTKAGKILFQTFADFGGYLVDDTAWDAHDFCIDQEADKEMLDTLGYSFSKPTDTFRDDVNRIVQLLEVVSNNSETSEAGGGKSTIASPPPFANPQSK